MKAENVMLLVLGIFTKIVCYILGVPMLYPEIVTVILGTVVLVVSHSDFKTLFLEALLYAGLGSFIAEQIKEAPDTSLLEESFKKVFAAVVTAITLYNL